MSNVGSETVVTSQSVNSTILTSWMLDDTFSINKNANIMQLHTKYETRNKINFRACLRFQLINNVNNLLGSAKQQQF